MIEFEYTVIRRPKRRTATVAVSCKDSSVVVTVPAFLTDEHVRQVVAKRSGWIRKHLKFNEEEREKYQPKQFVQGDPLAQDPQGNRRKSKVQRSKGRRHGESALPCS